jgi:hypothetical protein
MLPVARQGAGSSRDVKIAPQWHFSGAGHV